MQTALKVSVILLVANRRARSARALHSVLAQDGIEQAEVLLVDAGAADVEPLPGSDDPRVRVLRFASPPSFGQMRAEAVRQARGEIVAFLEDHVEARPGWLNGLIQAFEGPWAVVGPEVHNANPGVGLSEIVSLINYGRWAPPMTAGEAELLPGNNSAYIRKVLLSLGERLPLLLMSDTVLQWILREDGHRLFAAPEVSILHLNEASLSNALLSTLLYHWCFAAVRAEVFQWSLWRTLAYIAASPLIAVRRDLRLSRLYLRNHPDRAPSLCDPFFPLLTLLFAAVIGQAAGLAIGLEAGKMRFTDFELNSFRPPAREPG